MFLTQHFTPRLNKEWLPLATQQLRLRNLIQILGFNLKNDKKETIGTKSTDLEVNNYDSFYYTLHATIMSAPFYTSEKLKGYSPQWQEIQMSAWEGDVCGAVDAVVIRLWVSNPQESKDVVLSVWGVHLSGLAYLGPNLRSDIVLKTNSLVFLMPGGYFTPPESIESTEPVKVVRYTSMRVNPSEVRNAYSVNSLLRLHRLQQVIRKELTEVEILKKKISMGDFFRSENRGRTTLRKLLSKNKPKTHHADVMRLKENIEIAKYRVSVLEDEKEIILSRLADLNKQIETLRSSNQATESALMEKYAALRRDVLLHREWKKSYIDRREKYLHSKAMLNFRTKQLISELNLIYPIEEVSPEKYTICGVHLPNSEDFAGHDDLHISIALGFVTHVMQMVSAFLQIPLRYPVIHFGSRSRIIDQITDKIPDSEREFCLYVKGRERLQFNYAVYLLNKNIAQMRWLCGLPTSDLRNTLENLSSLIKMKVGSSNLDQGSQSLSSSTVDICSSTLSVSSPLSTGMSFQPKRNLRVHHLSESGVDVPSRRSVISPHVSGHRSTKSVGSSKELAHVLSRKHTESNLSFSLDKGLNEYEEVIGTIDNPNCPFGSEPSLNSNLPKTNQSEAKVKFLNTWNVESQKAPFSDDDSEVHVIGDRLQKQLSIGKDALEDIEKPEINEETEKSPKSQIVMDANTSPRSSVEVETPPKPQTPVKADTPPKSQPLGHAETPIKPPTVKAATPPPPPPPSLVAEFPPQPSVEAEPQPINIESDIKKCDFVTDSLLESVTSRTEALANQTTCFNRFRTRFKSTLESSN